MTPKRRAAINLSWFFICLCFSKSLLINCVDRPLNSHFQLIFTNVILQILVFSAFVKGPLLNCSSLF